MSVKALNHVWEHSPAKGVQLLVLLAIADYADEHGQAWPSMKALAAKARISERSAQYAVHSLAAAGEIEIAVGAGPRGTNMLRLQPDQGGANRAGVQNLHPANRAPLQTVQGAKSAPPLERKRGGAKSAPVQTAAPEPLKTSSSSSSVLPSEEDEDGGAGRSPTPDDRALVEAICDACCIDPSMLDRSRAAEVAALAEECAGRGFSEGLIRYAGEAWYTVKFNFKEREEVKPPHVKQLRPWIGQCARRLEAAERQRTQHATPRRAPIDYGLE